MKLKNLFKLLLIITFTITPASALKQETLKDEMGNKINTILLV